MIGGWKQKKSPFGISVGYCTQKTVTTDEVSLSIPFRYPFFRSTVDTNPILSIASGDTIGIDSATDINNQ